MYEWQIFTVEASAYNQDCTLAVQSVQRQIASAICVHKFTKLPLLFMVVSARLIWEFSNYSACNCVLAAQLAANSAEQPRAPLLKANIKWGGFRNYEAEG